MSERSVSFLLADIKVSIQFILEFTEDMNFEQYETDFKTRHAVERNFEIIGEAAARLSEGYRQNHTDIEWRILKDFRNFIIHEYFGVDNQIVWDTIQLRLTVLLVNIDDLLTSPNED